MKFLDGFLPDYEQIVINKKKIDKKHTKIYLLTLVVFMFVGGLGFLFGYLFDSLRSIGYLLTISNIIILITYGFKQVLLDLDYKKEANETYPTWKMVVLECLYVLAILLAASTFSVLTYFNRGVSLFTVIFYTGLLLIIATVYYMIFKKLKKLNIPNPVNIPVNGFFISILFYSLTALIHIEDISMSFLAVIPTLYALVLIKKVIENRIFLVIHRAVILTIGLFIVALAFSFSRAVNIISFQRGEFTFRIVYDSLVNPEIELPEGVTGDIILYDDEIIVVTTNEIIFYDNDLNVIRTIQNNYDNVYKMNGNLQANESISISTFVNVYIFGDDDFELVGPYYIEDANDKVYLEEEHAFLSINDTVYEKVDESAEYTKMVLDDYDNDSIITTFEDYIVLKDSLIHLATSESLRDDVGGIIYDSVAYNNGAFAFKYAPRFIYDHPNKVDPRDIDTPILYITDSDEYFANNQPLPISFVLPDLFSIKNFYHVNDHYYIVGFIQYITGDYNHKILVLNKEGVVEQELNYDGPNFDISEDYIAYGTDEIKLYALDTAPALGYHILEGYGMMFLSLSVVMIFGVKNINLDPKRNKMET